MSSNIRLQRICQLCGNEFTAKKTTTRYCGDICSKRAYKINVRDKKINASTADVQRNGIKTKIIEDLKAKEFLTVSDISKLLNCSKRTAYYLIERGAIKAVNIAERKTLIKRSEIDKLFEQPKQLMEHPEKQAEIKQLNESECYNLTEAQVKFGVSEAALQGIIKRNNIPKFRKGIFSLVPKNEIDRIFLNKNPKTINHD